MRRIKIRNPFTAIWMYFARMRSFATHNPVATNYAIDGLLVIGALNLAGSNNNIFAQRLGAGDFHLAMMQFLPQSINLLIIIPAGLFADSLRNKARMVSGALVAASFFFMVVAGISFITDQPLYFFLIFLALANASSMVYNIGWQGFFPEVVEAEKRNAVLTIRSRVSILVSLIAPLISGGILASIPSEEGKIIAHQVFYAIVAIMLLGNAFHLKKIKATKPAPPTNLKLREIKKASSRLLRNKPFVIFTLVALFFHMTWQMDWTLYFIGQANYLHMNEFQLSLTAVGSTAAHFLTLKFWSKRNQRHGVEKPVTFSILGFALCPVAILVSTSLPIAFGPTVFLMIHTFAMMFTVTVGLNFFQCLIPVLDEEYRSFSVSVYTCLMTLSNAVMPLAGVALYRSLGGNITGLRITFAIVFVLRIIAAGIWWLRIKKAPKGAVE
ncbi:MAG: MFS transporter [Defluviitaleaceae bacterium]|nr:MFS transporter [Defluviitaleaceae bacterium]